MMKGPPGTGYDPFDPENIPVNCPSCQKRPSRNKLLKPVDATTRKCGGCGRVEHWEQPDKTAHGERRCQRLLARQRKKFGDIDTVLFQWIAEPD